MELTVLMPCLNEARTLPSCIAKAKAFMARTGVSGEILIADNGSSDGSPELARRLGARVLNVAERGYGSALRAGIAHAQGRFIIMGDADDSYDFSTLDSFLAELRRGKQLVMGNRFQGGIARGAMPFHHRYFGNPVLSFIGRLLFRSDVGDFHCGLRGFDRVVVSRLHLESTGMEFASELIVKASLRGLSISEVPTRLFKDGRDRAPHLRSFRDGWRHLKFLLLHCPTWLFLLPGLALFLTGALLQGMIYFGPWAVGTLTLDVHSMLYGAALTAVGLQILVYWLLSQIVAYRNGVLPSVPGFVMTAMKAPLEAGLLFGIVLFSLGLGWTLHELNGWISSGFGSLDPVKSMKQMIPSITLMIVGCEIACAAVFISIALLGRPAASSERPEPREAWPDRKSEPVRVGAAAQ